MSKFLFLNSLISAWLRPQSFPIARLPPVNWSELPLKAERKEKSDEGLGALLVRSAKAIITASMASIFLSMEQVRLVVIMMEDVYLYTVVYPNYLLLSQSDKAY